MTFANSSVRATAPAILAAWRGEPPRCFLAVLLLPALAFLLIQASARGQEIGPAGPELGLPVPMAEGVAMRPPTATTRFAAEVGTGRIALDQVFEVWGPTWFETIALVRRGKLAADEGNGRLQESWTQALETVVREEVFYQEALRTDEINLQRYIDRAYEQAQASRRPGESGPSRRMVEREVRERRQRNIDRAANEMIERYTRASGGVERLKRVITRRGLTWEEWRERLVRKGFASYHVHMMLEPIVAQGVRPADIRDYYAQHREEFIKPGRVSFRHILFSYEARGGEQAAQVAARNVYDALVQGRLGFESAARKHSDDQQSRERGGLENDIAEEPEREEWLADVREAVRKETPGELGPILMSGIGYHLVTLVRTAPGQPVPFREAQRTMRERIVAQRREDAAQRYFAELRAAVHVKILMPQFPAELSCARTRVTSNAPVIPLAPGTVPEIGEEEPAR